MPGSNVTKAPPSGAFVFALAMVQKPEACSLPEREKIHMASGFLWKKMWKASTNPPYKSYFLHLPTPAGFC